MGLRALMLSAADAPSEAQPGLSVDPATPFESFAEGVLFVCVDIGIVVLFTGLLLLLVRALRGPTLVDRGVATDVISLLSAGVAILLTVRLQTLVMFDAVLIVSVLGFASVVAFAQFIARRGTAA